MALEPSVAEQALLADNFSRRGSRLHARERTVEAAFGSSFLLAVSALCWIDPPDPFGLAPALLCMAVLVLAQRVQFDTPFGLTSATQLAFVPLLFALPVALVPPAVAVSLVLARLPEVLAGEVSPSRLLLEPGNSWFAIGPAAVFALAGMPPSEAGATLLLAALAAQFSVDFAASALRFWILQGATLSEQVREAWVYGIDAALSCIGLVVAEDIHQFPLVALAPLPLLALLAMFARERRQRIEGLLELNNAYHGTALVLGNVVEADDGYTGEHCKSVVQLALALGEQLGLSAEQLRNLEFGALLHDVGKIAIPKEIINKPTRLDPEEWTTIKTHSVEGQRLLDQVGGFMHEVGLIVRSHHERWDGHGYPDGLAGEAIPLESRIIACCDAWNAMRTHRTYRPALSHDHALAELVGNAGRQFDPDLVQAFLKVIDESAPQA